MSEWIKDKNPDKDGEYLCIIEALGVRYLQVILNWTNDLYKTDPYAFEMYENKENRSGWYYYDSEWGGYNIKKVSAWCELPEIPEEFRKGTEEE